jgi:NitT/TauT family transport system substrate-binding protein
MGRLRALAAVVLFALLAPAVAGAGDRELVRLKVSMSPFLSWAPMFIGADEGLFEKRGIELEFIRMTGNTDAVPALVAKRIDVVPGMIAPGYFNLMARGADIRFVADKGHVAAEGCAYRGILARRDLVESGKLDDLGQLRGLHIASEKTSTSYYDVSRLLAAAGLTTEDVELVDVPYASKLDAFERGAIDVATASEPWLTMISDAGHAKLWKTDRDLGPNEQYSFIMFGPRLLNEDRELGVRFLMAYLESVRRYNEGKTERNIEILARRTDLSPDVVARACWVPIRDSGMMNPESMVEYQKWAVAEGLLDEAVPVETFWEPSLVEEAQRRLQSGE